MVAALTIGGDLELFRREVDQSVIHNRVEDKRETELNMYTNNVKSQRGFFLIILVLVVAIIIIVAAVLFATGVIKTPEATKGNGSCERLHKHCEDSCDNDSNCKNDCLTVYQQCKKEEGR